MGATNDDFKGMPDVGENGYRKLTIPTIDHETVDASSADATPTMLNCRYIYADTSGIVKFDYLDIGGNTKAEIMQVNAGVFYPVRNVQNVYRYYKGTTAITTTVFNASGSLVAGLKIRR
jgi:hypothetical protein